VLGRIVHSLIHAQHNGNILVGGRGTNDNLLGTCLDVGLGLVGVSKEACGFDHDVDTELAPGQYSRVALCSEPNPVAVDDQAVRNRLNGAGKAAIDRVIGQQQPKALGREQIVDTYDLHLIAIVLDNSLERLAPNAPKTVDTHFDHHIRLLSPVSEKLLRACAHVTSHRLHNHRTTAPLVNRKPV